MKEKDDIDNPNGSGSNGRKPLSPEENRGFPPGMPMGRLLLVALGLMFLLPLVWNMIGGAAAGEQISYTTFRNHLESGNVRAITIEGEKVQGLFRTPIMVPGSRGEVTGFTTYLPPFDDAELMPLLEQHNVQITSRPNTGGTFLALLINLIPIALFVWIGYSVMRSMRSQGNSIFSMTKSRAKRYTKTKERTTFDDVAGVEGAKGEVMEIVDFLKNPEKFHRLGAKTPTGVLLVGPPGTGKTLLARAIAGEADVPFFSMSGSDFMEMFVGVGASRVRSLFEDAKKNQPSIIFIDELDSIGRKRGTGLGGGNDEREQTLNQLLSELDGFERNKSTIVLAATNRPDILDPALLRPGRFDRRVTVDLPTLRDREEILMIHARKKPLAQDVSLRTVAQSTPGFSGADLENLLNEAALLAARKGRNTITQLEIEEARDKVLMGLERKSLTLTEEDKNLVAYHEAGHAVLAAVLPNTDPLHKVTIIPRDQAMGVTQQLPEREQYLYRKEYLTDRITVMFGGRAAEEIVFRTITSGAENDLKQATMTARKMVMDWGMSERLAHMSFGDRENIFLGEEIATRREFSENTAKLVDEEISGLLEETYRRAVRIIEENIDALHEVARTLVEREQLTGAEVKEIVERAARNVRS
jgi:cell division protease FtsH